MGSFQSWFRAAPLVRTQASIFAVGRRVYVACAGDGLAQVALTDDAGADARTGLADGTEVEILAWRPRKSHGTWYRVRATREGLEGWLAVDNLRSTPSACSAPIAPAPAVLRRCARAPEFRYAYHEVIEESQHTLMFQEFVNRAGFDLRGLPWYLRFATHEIVKLGRRFPELFFVFVLGGEDPIDHAQREILRSKQGLHPLTERIMRIHVTEEARHLSFARHYLRPRVPQLGMLHRTALSLGAPIILAVMSQLMLKASPQLVRTFAVPWTVVRSSYHRNPRYREATLRSLSKVRPLCRELGLLNPGPARWLWRALGIWAED